MEKIITEFEPKRIQDSLDQQGLSKNYLEKKHGIKRASVLQYVKGECCPNARTLGKLATALNCGVEYFFVKKHVSIHTQAEVGDE